MARSELLVCLSLFLGLHLEERMMALGALPSQPFLSGVLAGELLWASLEDAT